MTFPRLTVGPAGADLPGTTNVAVQAAVDRVAALGGGEVEVLPGTYTLEDSVHLRSHVTLCGHGAETVLRKAPCVLSALSADLGYGHFDISLAEPDKFRVGMGVYIADDKSGGFYTTVATLTWQDGDRFGINRMLNHDYSRGSNTVVKSLFPLVSGYNLTGARVENLVLDGNREVNENLNGCRGGGIFLLQAHGVQIRGVTVRNYNGDGISFQQTTRMLIEDCVLQGQTGCGLHPGSGSVGSVMRRNKCLGNAGDGIFYCLRVTYSLCEDNEISGNGHDGISIGGRDTHHIIRGNRITGSGRHGIYFRPADPVMAGNWNQIEGNTLSGNCMKEGDAEVFVTNDTHHVHLLGNRFAEPTKRAPVVGVRVAERCKEIVVAGNEFGGGFAREVEALCPEGELSYDPTCDRLPVGPENAPPGAALHLDVR